MGTVDYTAPEQIEGAACGPQTDVYSLGCVLFEALTGQPPYRRENELATLWAHVYTAPPSVLEVAPDLPAGFDDVVQRAMAKDPAERYASAGELGRARPRPCGRGRGSRRGDRPVRCGRRGAATRAAVAQRAGWRVLGLAGAAAPDRGASWRSWRSPDRTSRETERATHAGVVASLAGRLHLAPPAPRCRRRARTWRAPCWTGRSGSWADSAAGSKGSRKVEGYDPVINGWKSAPDLPVALHHEMVVTYKDELVVIGGWIPKGSDPSARCPTACSRCATEAGSQLPSLRRPRAAGAAAVVGDRIVVVGGQADDRLVDTTEVFDGKQWSDGADIPTPREHLAAASDGRYVYAVGGRDLSPDKNSAALERYDPAADSWQRLPDMPTARGGLGAAIVGGRLFAVGGETPTRVMGKVESYDIARKDWSRAPSMRTPRHGIAVAAIGRSLYALGGATRPGHASAVGTAEAHELGACSSRHAPPPPGAACPPCPPPARTWRARWWTGRSGWWADSEPGSKGSRKVEGYDPVINGWKSAPDLPVALHHEMVVTYKDEVVVIGGWIPKGADPSAEVSDRVFALRDGSWVAAALPAPGPRGGRGGRGGRPDRGHRRPGQRPPGRHHRGVRRQAMDDRGRHPDPA